MKYKIGLLMFFSLVFCWSSINPKDYFTWLMEVLPAIVGLVVLIITYKQFKFTNLIYTLMFIHSLILMVGGHYTYAEVPLFDWLKNFFGLERNNYDKVGHFAQGFIPVMIAREIFLKNDIVNKKGWLNFILVSICLAISAFYELVEWFVAAQTGESAEAFLGTQGYIWDTQSDMLFAAMGAICALILLGGIHNRMISLQNKI